MLGSFLLFIGVIVTAAVSGTVGLFLGGALKLGHANELAVMLSYLIFFIIAALMVMAGAGTIVAWIGLALFGLMLGSVVRGAIS